MKIVIMAGGKGTRISSLYSSIPKPMIKVLDKPILEYQIDTFRKQGFTDFIFVVGHLKEIIKDYFADGTKFGVKIEYVEENEPLGTAGSLYYLKDKVDDDFLLVNGDLIFDVDINRFYQFHKKYGGLATIFTHPNSHPYDSGIIVKDKFNKVIKWYSKEDEKGFYQNRVNAGIHFLSKKILDLFTEVKKVDLDRDILKSLIKDRKLIAYDSPEYVFDMGTPDRLKEVEDDIKDGLIYKKCLINKQKAIFLDRDGTINKYVGFLKNIGDLELLEGVSEAIQLINRSGYLAIVVTNQPVIARGEVSFQKLSLIHKKLETLLGKDGAYLDKIYFCPHHPDKGFEGERIKYKIDCDCRKPKPGMIFKAQRDFNIDLSKSYIIGDQDNDILCGINAGVKTILVNNKEANKVKPNYMCYNLLDAVKLILEEDKNECK